MSTNEVKSSSTVPAGTLEFTAEGEVTVRGADGMRYRRSVVIVVMDRRGLFLAGRRPDDRKVFQFSQGGAHKDETVYQTAEREFFEEMGLSLKGMQFLGEVLPLRAEMAPAGEERAAFRYPSKTWRNIGLWGQELYPLLYLAKTNVLKQVRFDAVPGEEIEFCEARWLSLRDLQERSSPIKSEAVKNICAGVEILAEEFLGRPVSNARMCKEKMVKRPPKRKWVNKPENGDHKL